MLLRVRNERLDRFLSIFKKTQNLPNMAVELLVVEGMLQRVRTSWNMWEPCSGNARKAHPSGAHSVYAVLQADVVVIDLQTKNKKI